MANQQTKSKPKRAWYQARSALLGGALLSLLSAYGTASLAIDTASILAYGATLILVVMSGRLTFLALRK